MEMNTYKYKYYSKKLTNVINLLVTSERVLDEEFHRIRYHYTKSGLLEMEAIQLRNWLMKTQRRINGSFLSHCNLWV